MQPAVKYCSRCKTPAAITASSCSSCSHEYRNRFAAPSAAPALPIATPAMPVPAAYAPVATPPAVSPVLVTAQAFQCPQCGNENTQKVSSLVSAGGWSSGANSVGLTVGTAWRGPVFGAVTSTHTAQTGASHQAKLLQPPPQPRRRGNLWWIGSLIMVPALLVRGTYRDDAAAFWIDLLVCLAFIGLTIWQTQYNARRYSDEMAVHARQMANWQMLSHCSRCDTVFHVTTRQFVPAGSIGALL